VYLYSLIAAEHDVRGFAVDLEEFVKKVKLSEMLNPCARGFRAVKIKPLN
jgi:redox-regulated HSP33 family molecular chaperone